MIAFPALVANTVKGKVTLTTQVIAVRAGTVLEEQRKQIQQQLEGNVSLDTTAHKVSLNLV